MPAAAHGPCRAGLPAPSGARQAGSEADMIRLDMSEYRELKDKVVRTKD